MKKVAIVGQYGEGPDYVTGQAVKTLFTARWLMKRFGAENVEIVNTYGWKNRPVRLAVSLLKAMGRCRNVVMLPAQNGVKVFAPLVAGLNRLFRRRIRRRPLFRRLLLLRLPHRRLHCPLPEAMAVPGTPRQVLLPAAVPAQMVRVL